MIEAAQYTKQYFFHFSCLFTVYLPESSQVSSVNCRHWINLNLTRTECRCISTGSKSHLERVWSYVTMFFFKKIIFLKFLKIICDISINDIKIKKIDIPLVYHSQRLHMLPRSLSIPIASSSRSSKEERNIWIAIIYILVSTPCISMQHCLVFIAPIIVSVFYYIASQNIWAISAITQCFYLIKRLHK